MGTWRVSADLLASSRFTVSPLTETIAGLTVLDVPNGPWQQSFHAANRTAYDEMLQRHPVRRDLISRAWRPQRGDRAGWKADFLGAVPRTDNPTFDDEVTALAELWDDDAIRSALHEVDPAPLSATLRGPHLREELLGLLHWIWSVTLEADWPRRQRVLQADIVSRTNLLATRGWSAVIPTLGARRQWLGQGRLQINRYDLPDRDLASAQSLVFIPAHSTGSWVVWNEPTHYALVYPVAGALAPMATGSRDGLGRLIGVNRARLLATLDHPLSTTHLAAVSGLPIGSVGNHLRVMLDAGLVLRRRSGREVRYWRTALGDSLLASAQIPDTAK